MSIPERIVVGPYQYRVVLRTDISEGEAPADGRISYTHQEIALNRDASPAYQRVTVVHELLHALLNYVGCDGETEKQQAYNEEYTNRIAPVLLDTLRRNPDLIDYLLEGDEHDEHTRADSHRGVEQRSD